MNTFIYHRQYLISRIRRNIPYMEEYKLQVGAYLYVGEGLQVRFVSDKNNAEYVLLGSPYCTDNDGQSIENCISAHNGGDINELVDCWTGKWLIIKNNEIQTDACGLMPAFYINEIDWCISSSLAILSLIIGKCPNKNVDKNGLTWHILPNTIISGVRGLLCTQKIRVTQNGLVTEFNPWIKDYTGLSTDEKIDIISKLLQTALKNISSYSGRSLRLALTAGKDSRLVLAAALASGVKFSTFTFKHPDISVSDVKVPKLISKKIGLSHTFIKPRSFSQDRENKYIAFTCGNSMGADLYFYTHGLFEQIPDDTLIIKSGLFEAGQVYARKTAGQDVVTFASDIKKYYESSFEDQTQKEAFEEWLEYIEQNRIDFLDVRDRMYLEQRVGGWASAIEQSLDINGCTSIQIANCRKLLSVLLSANEKERNELLLSYKTIEHLNPVLAAFPYNQKTITDKIKLVMKVLFSPSRLKRYIDNRIFKRFLR